MFVRDSEPWDPNRYRFDTGDETEVPVRPTQLVQQTMSGALSRESVSTHALKADKFEPRQCDKQIWHDTRGDSIDATNYSPSWSVTSGMYSTLTDARLYDQRDVHGFDAERKLYKGKRMDRMTGKECHVFEDAPPPRNGDFKNMGGEHSMRRLQGGHLSSDPRRERREQAYTASQLDDQSDTFEQKQRAHQRVVSDIRREMRQQKNGMYLENTNAITSTPYDHQQLSRNMPFVPSTERMVTSTKSRLSNPHHTHNNRQQDYDREELSRSLSDYRECDARDQAPRGHQEGAAHRSRHAERGRADRAALSSVADYAASAVSWGAVGGASQARYATVDLSPDSGLAHVTPSAHRPSDGPATITPQTSHPSKSHQTLPAQGAISAPVQGSAWSLFDGDAPVSDREQLAIPGSASVTTDAANGRATPSVTPSLFKEVDVCSRRSILVEEPRSHHDHTAPCVPQSISLAQRETGVNFNPPTLDGEMASTKAQNAIATSTAARESVSAAAGQRQRAPSAEEDGRGSAGRHAPTRHVTNTSRRSDPSTRHPLRGDDLHAPSVSASRGAVHESTRSEKVLDRVQLEHPDAHPTTASSKFTPLTSLETDASGHLSAPSTGTRAGAIRTDRVATYRSFLAVGERASRVAQLGSGDMGRGESARPGPKDPLRATGTGVDTGVHGNARRDAQLATLSQRQTPLEKKTPDAATANAERRVPTLEGSVSSDRALAPPTPAVTCTGTRSDGGERTAPTRHGSVSTLLSAGAVHGVDVISTAADWRSREGSASTTLRENGSHAHTMSTAVSREDAFHPSRADMAPHRSQAAEPHRLDDSASLGGLFGAKSVHMGALKAMHDKVGPVRCNEQRTGSADAVVDLISDGGTLGSVAVDTSSSTEMVADGASIGMGIGMVTNHTSNRATVDTKPSNDIQGRVNSGASISSSGAMVLELLRDQQGGSSIDISRFAGA